MTTTSLADHLRALTDERLVALFAARPDLAVPVPADLSVLAQRAHTRMSVARALDQLDRFQLEILDALRLAAGDDRRADRSAVLALVGADGFLATAAEQALDRLVELALAWPEGAALHLVSAVEEVSSGYPAGLGRPVGRLVSGHPTVQLATVLAALHLPATSQPVAGAVLAEALADPVRVRGLLERCPAEARSVVEKLAVGPPIGTVRDARRRLDAVEADGPIRWLLVRGLLVAVDEDTVELPREVGLAIRGDAPLGPLHPAQPQIAGRAAAQVDAAGAGQALEVLRHTEAVLDECAAQPPAALRSGGLGQRDLRRLAREAGVGDGVAALLLETAHAAGLVDQGTGADHAWLPTHAYDAWRTETADRRWSRLATAWLAMTRLPGLVGQRDEKDRNIAALSPEVERSGAPETRRLALGILAEAPPEVAVPAEDVVAVLAWRLPRRGGPRRDQALGQALAEAATLGVTSRGALTSYGRTLCAGGDPASVLHALLPEPVDHVLVQADLTVVAPGPLQPVLAADIALTADVESAGSATVYRVTADSVRRALDAGRSAEDLKTLFATRSRTPVPQAMTYLIDDVARRHGGLRAGAAGAYLRSDDLGLLTQILADRQCEPLRLRRLAPTVLVTTANPQRLGDLLRTAGYAPVTEDAYGALVLSGTQARRGAGRARPSRTSPTLPAFDTAYLTEAVAAVRRGDDTARAARRSPVETRLPKADAGAALVVLQQAARERHRVWLGYVDAHGGITARVVRPVSIGAGYLRAEDDRTDVLHTFALHRVTSAALAEDH